VLEAEPRQLAALEGIGPKNILGLKLVPAVARRYLEDKLLSGQTLASHQEAADYLFFTMGGLRQEVFRVLLMNRARQVMASEDIAVGTLDQAVVYPREVVARALAAGAAALVCAHNHPSGKPQPSRQDLELTRRLYHACRAVSLELVDHVIVGREEMYSLTQHGHLLACAAEYEALGL
jgi:DNA repair protein RadC